MHGPRVFLPHGRKDTLRERVFSHIPQHSQPIAIERKKGLFIARSLSLSPRHCIITSLSRLPCFDYTCTCLACGGKHARIAPSLPQYTIQQITLGHADNTNHALSTSSHPFSTQDPPSPGLVWSTTGLWPLLVEGGITELGQHRHYRAPRHCAPADHIPRIHTTARTNTY